jgi:hypothetical protein
MVEYSGTPGDHSQGSFIVVWSRIDVLEIITVFSARLYRSRSSKNKKILDVLKEAANEI